MTDRPTKIAELSAEVARGEANAMAALFPLVYDELRAAAAGLLRSERTDHTLQPTALVNEVYLKIRGSGREPWTGREHFRAIAALAMRQILVNHARDRAAIKRGGPQRRIATLSEAAEPAGEESAVDLLALDEALTRLAAIDETQARIVEMRYFAGMPADSIAAVLNVSERTVSREWRMARAWLAAQLRPEGSA